MILCSKHKRANAIHRCFTSRNTDLLVRVYCVYVRPLLEYNSVIWVSSSLNAISKPLKEFRGDSLNVFLATTSTVIVSDYGYFCYPASKLDVYDLIWCYKIVFRYTITYSDFFEFRLSNTRGHPYKLFKRRCSNGTRSMFFFSERVINVWNSLPCDIANFSSVKAFKRSLGAIELSVFCTGSF